MKFEFPENHGLSQKTVERLVFKENGRPALSNAQFAALSAGVGRGESILVVSPTSTGKTQIALWGIANSLESGCTTVYLVTHRALAKQKFEDFKTLLLPGHLSNNGSNLVIATGDYVEDADGEQSKDPLGAPLLVATYEKYLALLSAAGVPSDMRRSVIICDEIQLVGDNHRGQNVEVLLALLRNAGWKQFVGLSAVLQHKDAADLANWLGVTLVVEHAREKHLRYECWTPNSIAASNTETPDSIAEGLPLPNNVKSNPISAINFLLNQKNPLLPIIVFCMKKQDTYDLSKEYLEQYKKNVKKGQLSLVFDDLPETTANAFLAESMAYRVAFHNADLTDDERNIVEQHLLNRQLDIVFATSTLAAGVNFPLGAAIFAEWKRWDANSRSYIPIESAEFHNMAGRVGRMGFEHEHGRVIYFAKSDYEVSHARKYLNLGALPALQPRVNPQRFDQLALQLTSSGLCSSRSELEVLIFATFSALKEQDKNPQSFAKWPQNLSISIDNLLSKVFLIESSSGVLKATPIGKAVGYSGLMPETCTFLLEYIVSKAQVLINCLPTASQNGEIEKLAFLLFNTCLSSAEFRGSSQTRHLPWPLEKSIIFDAECYSSDLAEPIWQADFASTNGAKLTCEWINGAELKNLEGLMQGLSAGMLLEMFRNIAWVLQGLSAIVTAAADKRVVSALRPEILNSEVNLDDLAKLPRLIHRLSIRLSEGLPDDVLWMMSLNQPNSKFRITRTEILAFKSIGYSSPEKIMQGSADADAIRASIFSKAKPNPQTKSNWLRDACREWKSTQRQRAKERHLKRASRCSNADVVERFYSSKGTDFEKVFEEILKILKIDFEKLDDKNKVGAPDYLVKLQGSPELIIELKSKDNDKLVDYNKAVEVLSASEIHGYKEAFCVTLCHPGVDPSVPLVIASCGRLSVVESTDLGEGLLRLCENTLSQQQLWQWLASPGQALAADLPFREYA